MWQGPAQSNFLDTKVWCTPSETLKPSQQRLGSCKEPPQQGPDQSRRSTGGSRSGTQGAIDSLERSDSNSGETLEMMIREKLASEARPSGGAKSKYSKNSRYRAQSSGPPPVKFSLIKSQNSSTFLNENDPENDKPKSLAKGASGAGSGGKSKQKQKSSRPSGGNNNYPHLPRINENPQYSSTYAGQPVNPRESCTKYDKKGNCLDRVAGTGAGAAGQLLDKSISKTISGGTEKRNGAKITKMSRKDGANKNNAKDGQKSGTHSPEDAKRSPKGPTSNSNSAKKALKGASNHINNDAKSRLNSGQSSPNTKNRAYSAWSDPNDAKRSLKSSPSNPNNAKKTPTRAANDLNDAKSRLNSAKSGPNDAKMSLNRAKKGSKRVTGYSNGFDSENGSEKRSRQSSAWSRSTFSRWITSNPPLHQQRQQLQDEITAQTEDLFPRDPSFCQDGNQNICYLNNPQPKSYKLAPDTSCTAEAEEIRCSLEYKTINGQTDQDCLCGCGSKFVHQGQGQQQSFLTVQGRLSLRSEDKAQQCSGPQEQEPVSYVDQGQQQSFVSFQDPRPSRFDKSEQFIGSFQARSIIDQGQQFRGVSYPDSQPERDSRSRSTLYPRYSSHYNFRKRSDPNANFFSGRKSAQFTPKTCDSKDLPSAEALLRSAQQILIDAAQKLCVKRHIPCQVKCRKSSNSNCMPATERDSNSCSGGSLCRPPRKHKRKRSSVCCQCCTKFDFDGCMKQQQQQQQPQFSPQMLMQIHSQLQALGQGGPLMPQFCPGQPNSVSTQYIQGLQAKLPSQRQSVNFPNNDPNGVLLLPLIPQQNGQVCFNPMLLQQNFLNKGFRNSSPFQPQIHPVGQMLPQQLRQGRASTNEAQIMPPAAAQGPRLSAPPPVTNGSVNC